jgi:hypothetical protein
MTELTTEETTNLLGCLATIIDEARELDAANPGGNAATIIEQADAATEILERVDAKAHEEEIRDEDDAYGPHEYVVPDGGATCGECGLLRGDPIHNVLHD